MQIDFGAHLGAVTRSVQSLEREGKPARKVTLQRSYSTTPDDLWDAVTNPERLPRWFLPITGDLQLGGRYQLQGNAGGTVTECDPPRSFAATWEFGDNMSWIEVQIDEDGKDEARLTLSHICPLDDHWRQYGPAATGIGWDLGLIGLAIHVSSPDAALLDEAALAGSDEGRAFIAGSSEDWRRAAVDGGEDPDEADAAAKRTMAFYTGQDSEA